MVLQKLRNLFGYKHKIQLHLCKLNHREFLLQLYDMKTSRIKQTYLFKPFQKTNWWTDMGKYSMPNFINRMKKYES